ncbi:hypothetical protein [Acetobacter persici]|uniref:hypothetical protein n=1 Tax=Acetobacter persici TaxID=1076596 RepID=UPI0020CB771D|nr:hypothetical protein [Acetobacter persici]
MPHLDTTSDEPRKSTGTPLKRCLGKGALAVGVCMLACAGLVLHQSKAYGLLARIHHGLIICTPGTGLSMTAGSAGLPHQNNPGMLRLELASQDDGRVIVVPGSNPLNEVLASSRRAHTLLMLDLNDTNPTDVALLVRKARMRDRVVLVPSSKETTEVALQADPSILVAIPVHSTREAYAAHRMAGHHPYAAYLSPNAAPDLFTLVHRDAEAVITENPIATNFQPDEFLAERPVDIVVTPQTSQVPRTLARDS